MDSRNSLNSLHSLNSPLQAKWFRRGLISMGVLVLALIGANFGLTWAVVAASQQTTVTGDVPVMLVKGTDVPVQTASHEFMVAADGSLQMRNSSGGPSVIQTSVATQQMPLSSALPDEAFFELKTVGLVSPTGVSMHLTVLGFMREPSLTGLDTVTLITHIGRVILVGTELSYVDDTQAALFSQAGFMLSASGRRLLQVRQLFGIFNAISSLSKNTTYSVPAPSLPDQFVMFARRRSPCIPWPLNGTNTTAAPVTWVGGALPVAQGLDLCTLLNISSDSLINVYDPTSGNVVSRYVSMTYTMYRLGSTLLRVEYTHPFVPGTMLVEVIDNSVASAPLQFSYQVSDVDRGLGLVSASVMADHINATSPDIYNVTVSGDAPFLVGPVAYYNPVNVTTQDLVGDMLGASMDYLGDTDINGEPVRIWALHLNNNSFHAYWYDSIANQTVRRIAFDGIGELDILRILPLDGDASMNSYLFTPPVPGITLSLDDNNDSTPVQLPAKLSLDPFLPYKRAAEGRIAAPPASTPASRRLLRQAQITSPTFVRRNLHGLVDSLNEFGPAKTAGGRGLMQAFPGTCAANNLCSVNPSTVGSMNSFIPSSPGQQPATPSVVSVGYGPLFSFVNGPVGNGSRPCYYSFTDNYGASIGWPAPNPLFPTPCPPLDCGPLTLTVTGGITLQFGADLSCITSVAGTVSLTIGMGLPAIAQILGKATFNPLSWNLLSITVGVYTNPITETCSAPTNSAISINLNDPATAALLGPLTSVYSNAAAGAVCRCLAANTMSTQVGLVVAGPDIPGLVLAPVLAIIPGLDILTPLLVVRAPPSLPQKRCN